MASIKRPPITVEWLQRPRRNPLASENLRPHVLSNWDRIAFLRRLSRGGRAGIAITMPQARNYGRLIYFMLQHGLVRVEGARGRKILVKLEPTAPMGVFSKLLEEVGRMRKWQGGTPSARPRLGVLQELGAAFEALAKDASVSRVFVALLGKPGVIQDLSPSDFRRLEEPLKALEVRGLLKIYRAGKPGVIGIELTRIRQADARVQALAQGKQPG